MKETLEDSIKINMMASGFEYLGKRDDKDYFNKSHENIGYGVYCEQEGKKLYLSISTIQLASPLLPFEKQKVKEHESMKMALEYNEIKEKPQAARLVTSILTLADLLDSEETSFDNCTGVENVGINFFFRNPPVGDVNWTPETLKKYLKMTCN